MEFMELVEFEELVELGSLWSLSAIPNLTVLRDSSRPWEAYSQASTFMDTFLSVRVGGQLALAYKERFQSR